ncbi:MAG: DUF2652 domain-containing protein [Gammaproteobacteria bacterium]|nr:MAG: DUF2652 domain-containing protein [Gammaproteobacteria bacterium]
MNDQVTHQVLLMIADISGYTKFMVSSDLEIEHSQRVISELIQTIIEQVEIPLEVSKLEGDAIFLYVKKDSDVYSREDVRKVTGEKLILFFDAFHEKLQELRGDVSCSCGACSNLHALKLKIVVHSGEALFYRIHHFNELSGSDVILVHRLLKNSMTIDEYLLMTEAAYAEIEFPCQLPVEEGSENYEHLGKVKTFVYSPASAATP